MEKNIKFREYNRKSILDSVYELMLHIGLPITVEIMINELWLHDAGFSNWVSLLIILGSVLVTLLISVCVLTPIINYFKNWHVTKFNKWLKENKLGWFRSDMIKNQQLNEKMKTISKEGYDEIIKCAKSLEEFEYYSDTFVFEQNFFTREITGLHNEHDFAKGKLVSHSFSINRKDHLLKMELTHVQEITMEAKYENPKLTNFTGRMQIVFNYKTNSLYYFYYINEPSPEFPNGLYGVTFKSNNEQT